MAILRLSVLVSLILLLTVIASAKPRFEKSCERIRETSAAQGIARGLSVDKDPLSTAILRKRLNKLSLSECKNLVDVLNTLNERDLGLVRDLLKKGWDFCD